jgi:23S rRNA pseudouridine1911/1915/1917 synthase
MDLARLLAAEEVIRFRVQATEEGQRLDRLLAVRLPFASRATVAAWIREGRARVDGSPVERPGRAARAGQEVEIRVKKTPRDLEASIDDLLEIPIVHRGPDFLVVDKPAGLPSHPGGGALKRTLLVALGLRLEGEHEPGGPWLPHRLDRETRGLSVVALSRAAMTRLSRAFAEGEIRRLYTARLRGTLPRSRVWIDLRLPLRAIAARPRRFAVDAQGMPAHTRMRVLASDAESSTVRLEAVTGRQHQLRVHVAELGHPILGDPLYDPHAERGATLALCADELRFPAQAAAAPHPLVVRLSSAP